MYTATGVNFEWPEASEIAQELSEPGKSKDIEVIAGRISTRLNDLVPEYDYSHSFYSPMEAIEIGATTCKTRAYMAHAIAVSVEGIKSAIYLGIFNTHASTYVTNKEKAVVIDSTNRYDIPNSFIRPYAPSPDDPDDKSALYDPMIEFFRTTEREEGFAWITANDSYDTHPSGQAMDASTFPLCYEIPDLLSGLMFGQAGYYAMQELLMAKQEVADLVGPALEETLSDNTLFPNAFVKHPSFT